MTDSTDRRTRKQLLTQQRGMELTFGVTRSHATNDSAPACLLVNSANVARSIYVMPNRMARMSTTTAHRGSCVTDCEDSKLS
jgi:hypothetical protein